MITDATTIAELAEILRRNGGGLRSLILEIDGGENDRVQSVYRAPGGLTSSTAYLDGDSLASAISAALAKAGAR